MGATTHTHKALTCQVFIPLGVALPPRYEIMQCVQTIGSSTTRESPSMAKACVKHLSSSPPSIFRRRQNIGVKQQDEGLGHGGREEKWLMPTSRKHLNQFTQATSSRGFSKVRDIFWGWVAGRESDWPRFMVGHGGSQSGDTRDASCWADVFSKAKAGSQTRCMDISLRATPTYETGQGAPWAPCTSSLLAPRSSSSSSFLLLLLLLLLLVPLLLLLLPPPPLLLLLPPPPLLSSCLSCGDRKQL